MEGEAAPAVAVPTTAGHQGVVPRKRIGTQADVQRFQASPTYKLLQTWLHALNKATLRKSNTAPAVLCPAVEGALALLERVDKLVDETPPETGEMRFGNKAFRTWHAKLAAVLLAYPHLSMMKLVMKLVMALMVVMMMVMVVTKAAEELHKLVLPEEKTGATQELVAYLLDSFGNAVRIDYGTGHELHFVIWMYCLHALGLVQQEHLAALVTRVFARYLTLVRKVQQTYGQEPAGSRGVWCLDDHQFVPFIWGAAQLIDNPDIQPGSIMDKELVARHADEYLYLGCIHYIHTVKKGPFFEHSPDLYNISGAASWEKINKGMFMKYNQDVLSKLPVLQHMLFGSLFPYA